MILRALYDLAQRERLVADPDFQPVKVSWAVRVSQSGEITSIDDIREAIPGNGSKPARHLPRSLHVPLQAYRSGTKPPPYFCVDNAKYVFGVSVDPKKPLNAGEGAARSGAFRSLLEACLAETGDEGVRATHLALERWSAGHRSVMLPADCRANDQFAFVYEPDIDTYLHERPAVSAYWRALRVAQGRDTSAAGTFECVVTGEPVGSPSLFPGVKGVPGGQSSGAMLVSFNSSAFESYGLEGSANAPMSRPVAEAVATALRRLVDPAFPSPDPSARGTTLPKRHVRIGQDTLVCFWAASETGQLFTDALSTLLERPNPEVVGELHRAPWSGQPASAPDDDAFYVLTISGAQARVVVRDWIESTIKRTHANIVRYFEDLAIVRNTPSSKGLPPAPQLPLGILMRALAPFGRADGVPPGQAGAFVRAALEGTRFPVAILQRALERTRAEIGRGEWDDHVRLDARAMLIKAVLCRTFNHELSMTMDESNRNPGYLCGRLLAVLERLQQVALGDVNASVVDRYFGAASATPRSVFVRLLRNAAHHARKAADDPKTEGSARWLKRTIDQIVSQFDPDSGGFPAHLGLEAQGLFVLGYHQQRHALWTKRATAAGEPSPDSNADAA